MDLSRRFQTHIQMLGRQQGWNWDYTGDLSRILRLPGTLNHKDKSNLKPVRLYETSDHRYDPAELEGFLPADSHEPEPPRHTEVIAHPDFPQADLSPILDNCLFMTHFRDDASSLREPEWVAGLTIGARCTDAVENAHKLSEPYAGYSYKDTEAKLLHAKNKMGPRTCSLIHDELAPNLCESCASWGKITSPIQLGYESSKNRTQSAAQSWNVANHRFPAQGFCWDVLPKPLADSLKSAAISCNTSSNAVPGIAIATMASIFGRKVTVYATRSWAEPMIFWFADVRDSGEGKTPVQKLIIGP